MPEVDRILKPGETCWRIEPARRLAVIVDAADYFRLVKAAMLKARHSIMLIGWDFDTRIAFEPDGQTLEGPNRLGDFISWLPKQRAELNLYLLKWDLGMVQALGRGMTPVFILNWMTSSRVRLRLDGAHPVGAAHHQKIVVIDDALAVCGGIDMTVDRWDTRGHLDGDPRRAKPGGKLYGPWHDATIMVEGAVAQALGELARERWRKATQERLPAPPRGLEAWPDDLEPTLTGVDVAIARTFPGTDDDDEVREIEALYLRAIGAASLTIYLESQYLASRTIAEALAARLGESEGPEIVIVLPQSADGWLEQKAMDGARRKLLHLLWRADNHGRLGVYYPVTASGEAIYVHAKIMIVDDRLLRVGSSNINNRSMGFDTECDLAVEADDSAEQAGLRETISSIRRDLVCEHLGVDEDRLVAALDGSGSLLTAIESLRGEGRTLGKFEAGDVEEDDSVLAENELVDPESTPASLSARVAGSVSDLVGAGLGRIGVKRS
jgi:phosphatidylserine/phosphatidylglycerophosphate/cardiolipin synthase-like enzyme